MPSSRQARATRTAISPRFAIRTLLNISLPSLPCSRASLTRPGMSHLVRARGGLRVVHTVHTVHTVHATHATHAAHPVDAVDAVQFCGVHRFEGDERLVVFDGVPVADEH